MKTLEHFLVFLLAVALPALALQGCDLIDYHPYDARFTGARDINARNIARIEAATAGRDSLRFVVISDTQRWYDETHAAVNSINARGNIDFVIHCGDLTDFSATEEFEWMRRELERLAVPYVCLIGNHDCLANGPNVFRAMFGPTDFSFTAGDTHFVCLDTNALEHDYSVPIPNFTFLQADADSVKKANGHIALPTGGTGGGRTAVRRTIVAMHAAPYTDQFNNNVATIFRDYLHAYPGLLFCVCGHQHKTAQLTPFADGITYYQCGAAKGRQYLVFTLTREGGMTYEEVDF